MELMVLKTPLVSSISLNVILSFKIVKAKENQTPQKGEENNLHAKEQSEQHLNLPQNELQV